MLSYSRKAISQQNVEKLCRLIRTTQPKNKLRTCHTGSSRVLLCSGQGAQYVGMLEESFMKHRRVQQLIKMASDTAGWDILNLCRNGPKEALDKTVNCQILIVLSTLVAAEIMQMENTKTVEKQTIIAGYSVGEIAALALGKSVSYEDAITLVKGRAEAMQYASDQNPSGMLFIQGLPLNQAKELCENATIESNAKGQNACCVVAIEAYDKGYSIGGSLDCLEQLQKEVTDLGYSCTRLAVSGAFHTPLMAPAQDRYSEVLSKIKFKLPDSLTFSNVTGEAYNDESEIARLLLDQLVSPVKWKQIMERILSLDKNLNIYELGPGKQLKPMVGKINRRLLKSYTNVSV